MLVWLMVEELDRKIVTGSPMGFLGALGRPLIPSPINAQYWRCIFIGWPGQKRWLS